MNCPSDPTRRRRRRPSLSALLALAAMVLLLVTVLGYAFYRPVRLGPEQPVAFSHRFHVAEKQVSCLFCHFGAVNTDRAGVPPLETCMLCHQHVITEHPMIVHLREAYDADRPVQWVRVTGVPDLVVLKRPMPDFVFFSHAAHVRQGFDCGECHGDVRGMDRLRQARTIDMGFCMQCHRDHQASTDCLVCHR
jgi:hypothetical protein